MMIAGSKTIVQDFRNSKIPSILIKQIQKARRAAESRVNASAVKRVFPVSKDEFNPEAGKEILRQIKADATETLKIATEAETKRAEKARPARELRKKANDKIGTQIKEIFETKSIEDAFEQMKTRTKLLLKPDTDKARLRAFEETGHMNKIGKEKSASSISEERSLGKKIMDKASSMCVEYGF